MKRVLCTQEKNNFRHRCYRKNTPQRNLQKQKGELQAEHLAPVVLAQSVFDEIVIDFWTQLILIKTDL